MDLTQSQSNLSRGFLSHASTPHRTPITDSILFQIDSRSCDPSHPVPAIPLQLMEQQSENHKPDKAGEGIEGEDGDDEKEVKEFRILGHSMCLKRKRDSESLCSSSPKWIGGNQPDMESRRNAVRAWGSQPLSLADAEIFKIMEKEKQRQYRGIELIASENYLCSAVMEALGSHLTNKYSEGMPGARYYGGNQYIDEIEMLCCERALAAFGLEPES